MQQATRDARAAMVRRQIAGRGIAAGEVLDAVGRVPRERFVPEAMQEFAYEDSPLPIGHGQTISQPYIVALMVEHLNLKGGERVLEVGTGAGYAAAVLAEIAGEVVTIERHQALADLARRNLAEAGYTNVTVIHGDGTLGCAERAPFDGIVVAAGGPRVPESLRRQLSIGGRLVIPVGETLHLQTLMRITRTGEDTFEEEDLDAVRFVPLIGDAGWRDLAEQQEKSRPLPDAVAAAAEPFDDLETVDLAALLDRIGDAKVVLIGEASHGTSEFYALRARITRDLIERKGFSFVAAEADWPDAARIDAWVRDRPGADPRAWQAFARFPTWMWRNAETRTFVDWLHGWNKDRPAKERVGFHGLDMYSMYTSIGAVLDYLDDTDPEAAAVARERYGCLTPWQHEPQVYGRAAITSGFARCREGVALMLRDMLDKRMRDGAAQPSDGERLFDAEMNARLVASAEEYYRVMYRGGAESWNLRDSHMFEILNQLLDFRGEGAKAVVWAHNSHIGDAAATEMALRGEHNIGRLCRDRFGQGSYHIGFGTHSGTVAAATDWDGPMEIKTVRPSHERSIERVCHDASGKIGPNFLLPVRDAPAPLRRRLTEPLLQRAIGVIYRPQTELASHYFETVLSRQFDEYIWFDTSTAVTALRAADLGGMPDTYPFGL